ncbi:MAG: hypothetical protein HUJ61_02385, partial [Bacilli bacterium]|nr:hypothetical protein [Bacilli bacterium]
MNNIDRFVTCNRADIGVIICINGWTFKSTLKNLPTYLDKINEIIVNSGVLISKEGHEICPLCGTELTSSTPVEVCKGTNIKVCASCMEKSLKEEEEQIEGEKAIPDKKLLGTLGALLGASIGAIATIVFSLFGFITAYAAVIGAVLGAFFYKKFGGKQSTYMVVITTVSSFVLQLLGMFLVYLIV